MYLRLKPIYKFLYFNYKNFQDKNEIEILNKYISKDDIVLDIGANIGFYSVLISKWVGCNGMVYSFEPDKLNYTYLKDTCKSKSNIFLNNKAVGSLNGKLILYQSNEINVDHRTYKPDNFSISYEVDVVSIDNYFANNFDKINFIKMDIQGYEFEAIKGMRNLLEKNKEIKLLTEFWPYGLKQSGSSAIQYFNYLVDLNFNIYLLEKNNLLKLDEKKVIELNDLPLKFYFNILVKRDV
jgi:FkbM family methyltransferase